MKRFLPLFLVAVIVACSEDVFSPEEVELPNRDYVIREFVYSAADILITRTDPVTGESRVEVVLSPVTQNDTVAGRGLFMVSFRKDKTMIVTCLLEFTRWGPSSVHPRGEPFLFCEGTFVGTYGFTTTNTFLASFPGAVGQNAWLNGEWFYGWDGEHTVPAYLAPFTRLVLTPATRR